MKILVSYRGIPQSPGWATGDLVFNAFKSMGYEVYTYGYYYQNPKNRLPNNLTIEQAKRETWDLVLYMECNDPDPQYVELKHLNSKKFVYWDFDASYHLDHTLGFVNYMRFDHIFCANILLKEYFKRYAPTTILPYAFCKDKHCIVTQPDRTMRFAMVGSNWGERQKIYEALIKERIPVDLVVNKFREEYIEALASTHVCINHNVKSGRGLLVMRIFEALGAKTCLLTNDADGIQHFLTPDQDCIVYKDIPHLIEICRGLNAPKGMILADQIAEIGHKTGIDRHTYHHRCQKILRVLNLE